MYLFQKVMEVVSALMASKNSSLCKDFSNKDFEINEKEFFKKLPILVEKFNSSIVNYKKIFRFFK